MATTPPNEDADFEREDNELPEDTDGGSEDSLEDDLPEDDADIDDVQEEAAEERKEGGYQ